MNRINFKAYEKRPMIIAKNKKAERYHEYRPARLNLITWIINN